MEKPSPWVRAAATRLKALLLCCSSDAPSHLLSQGGLAAAWTASNANQVWQLLLW